MLGDRVPLLPIYFASIFAWAAALVGAGVAPLFAVALGALAGVANGIDNVATDTILQKQVPDALLGRVFSVRFTSYSAAEAITYPLGGLLVDASGGRQTYIVSGLATVGAGALLLLVILALLRRHQKTEHT